MGLKAAPSTPWHDELDNLYQARAEITEQLDEIRRAVGVIEDRIAKHKAQCPHQYRDGRSSLHSGFMATSCMLCGWNDL